MQQSVNTGICRPLTSIVSVMSLTLLFLISIFFSTVSYAEQWVLGIPKDDRPPLTYTQDGKHVGLIIDIVREVGRRIDVDIKIEVVGASERRKGFVKGQYVIECCIIEGWRTRPEEIAIQLFSDPVLQIQDIFIFPPHQAFPISSMESLKDKEVGTIRGYSYKGEENFGSRVDHESVLPLLQGISSGRVDVGIFQRRAAAFHSRQSKLNLTFGPLHHEVQASIRLHKNKAEYLPEINAAIRDMYSDGTFKSLSDQHSSWMRK
ncbi:substrate-binding periplasmic protein [Kiloniella sp.]|uniref:substrate-binding periplasmic protein n=1 Tax=Kiloniella sp. TaxID=1938587 RepID=UPI003B014F09